MAWAWEKLTMGLGWRRGPVGSFRQACVPAGPRAGLGGRLRRTRGRGQFYRHLLPGCAVGAACLSCLLGTWRVSFLVWNAFAVE